MMKKGFLSLLAILSVIVLVNTSFSNPNLPENKQTSLGLYVNSERAYAMWKNDPVNVAIIDCRTPEEYVFVGHPTMAYNIPSKLMTHDYDPQKKTYKMMDNPEFTVQVKKHFNKKQTLLILCRSGGRSAKSVNTLAKAGFTNVYTITDGFEGDKVSDENSYFKGRRLVNGWKNSGSPWTYECDKSLMYFSSN